MQGQTRRKNILIVTSRLPFVYGGNSVLAETLSAKLREYGCTSDVWYTPQNRFGRQTTAYLANRFTDVGFTGTNESVHQVISIRFPSFAVKHTHHVCWLNHCMREYYDLWDHHSQRISSPIVRLKENFRKTVFRIRDKHLLKYNVTKLFAQSHNIAGRLKEYFNITCETLYPPPRNDLSYKHGSYGNYILAVSRLNERKRLHVFVKSFALLKKTGLRGLIVGDGEEYANLKQLIEKENLENIVELRGNVSNSELGRLYADALAVYFAPIDEDYGNVTLEAFGFSKPVITAPDSGGPLEFVKHMETGCVVDPFPETMADVFSSLYADKRRVEELGNAAKELSAGITWEQTIPRLLIT